MFSFFFTKLNYIFTITKNYLVKFKVEFPSDINIFPETISTFFLILICGLVYILKYKSFYLVLINIHSSFYFLIYFLFSIIINFFISQYYIWLPSAYLLVSFLNFFFAKFYHPHLAKGLSKGILEWYSKYYYYSNQYTGARNMLNNWIIISLVSNILYMMKIHNINFSFSITNIILVVIVMYICWCFIRYKFNINLIQLFIRGLNNFKSNYKSIFIDRFNWFLCIKSNYITLIWILISLGKILGNDIIDFDFLISVLSISSFSIFLMADNDIIGLGNQKMVLYCNIINLVNNDGDEFNSINNRRSPSRRSTSPNSTGVHVHNGPRHSPFSLAARTPSPQAWIVSGRHTYPISQMNPRPEVYVNPRDTIISPGIIIPRAATPTITSSVGVEPVVSSTVSIESVVASPVQNNIPVAVSFVQAGIPEAAASGHRGGSRIAVVDQARPFRELLPNGPLPVPSSYMTGSDTPSMSNNNLQSMPENLGINFDLKYEIVGGLSVLLQNEIDHRNPYNRWVRNDQITLNHLGISFPGSYRNLSQYSSLNRQLIALYQQVPDLFVLRSPGSTRVCRLLDRLNNSY